jgi:CDP-paratose 2-epimerase
VADTRKAQAGLGLSMPVPWRLGVARLAHWLAETRDLDAPLDRRDELVVPQAASA